MNRLPKVALGCLALVAFMSGCAAPDEDLKAELKSLVQGTRSGIDPLPVVVPYKAFAYEASDMSDPFSPTKVALRSRQAEGVQPDLKRNKEPLESYAVEQMRMVGTMRPKDGALIAVMEADGALYRLRVGNHMGQNYGRITEITEAGLTLMELYQEPNGDWTEKQAMVALDSKQSIEGKTK